MPGPVSRTSTTASAPIMNVRTDSTRAPARIGHRLLRVHHQVEEHLLDLFAVGQHQRQQRRVILADLDAGHLQLVGPHPHRRLDDLVEIEQQPFVRRLPDEAQQVADDAAGAAGFEARALDVAAQRGSSGCSSTSSSEPMIDCSGLLISCATPETNSPSADSRSPRTSCSRSRSSSVMSRITATKCVSRPAASTNRRRDARRLEGRRRPCAPASP